MFSGLNMIVSGQNSLIFALKDLLQRFKKGGKLQSSPRPRAIYSPTAAATLYRSLERYISCMSIVQKGIKLGQSPRLMPFALSHATRTFSSTYIGSCWSGWQIALVRSGDNSHVPSFCPFTSVIGFGIGFVLSYFYVV